jgi:hypothetical protein
MIQAKFKEITERLHRNMVEILREYKDDDDVTDKDMCIIINNVAQSLISECVETFIPKDCADYIILSIKNLIRAYEINKKEEQK